MSTKSKARRKDRRKVERLLKWAIEFVNAETASLAACHYSPTTKRVEPLEVRREVRSAQRWLKEAREAVK